MDIKVDIDRVSELGTKIAILSQEESRLAAMKQAADRQGRVDSQLSARMDKVVSQKEELSAKVLALVSNKW